MPNAVRGPAGCLRCRLLGVACDGAAPQCGACAAVSADCLPLSGPESARLLGALPQQLRTGNAAHHDFSRLSATAWKRLPTGKQFVQEASGTRHGPEGMAVGAAEPVGDNPLVAGALKEAVETYPDLEGPDNGQLPLPSSELLGCIGEAIAAQPLSESQPLSQHMHASSLLALGVLLQEYSAFLL
ncbi:hypothetical protein GGF46_001363 [Coemansia sp. RSA 552]|nr:hypothetical protein GGF46_001363 [Coemansia sp. RSA 552]